MTLEMIYDGLVFNQLTAKEAKKQLELPEHRKEINYYVHRGSITTEPLPDGELARLNALVNTLQILYNSECDSPISDSDYETLQEMLIDNGVPRITSDAVIMDDTKLSHRYQQLRGTLHKVHYLDRNAKRVNASRKYLDEWVAECSSVYTKSTGDEFDPSKIEIMLQPKFDGDSVIAEVDTSGNVSWLTRGDTKRNLAKDVSKVMRKFDDLILPEYRGGGIKFEVMTTEDDKTTINRIMGGSPYKNSRQIVTACITSTEPDFKSNYLYPVALRYVSDGDEREQIHPDLIAKFPTKRCMLSDIDVIHDFAVANAVVVSGGMSFRTDGVVITIMDTSMQAILGRSNNINNFEVAYKFTEERAYPKVKDVEFCVSEFGYITPVLVTADVILKGNTINHPSLHNKDRFDELQLHYGDTVCVAYDIIPYVTIDDKCHRAENGKLIEFTKHCPSCNSELDLNCTLVRCDNPNCPAIIIGRVANWCSSLKIHNLGYQTLETIHRHDLLKHGIRSLYKLRSKIRDLEDVPGLGQLSAKKIVNEIEAKRRLKDYEAMGSIGIDGLSVATFGKIFKVIKFEDFVAMTMTREFDKLQPLIVGIPGLGDKKADTLIEWLKSAANRKELGKLLDELRITESFASAPVKKVIFSGFRPNAIIDKLESFGYRTDGDVTRDTICLVIPTDQTVTDKTGKADKFGIPKIIVDETNIDGAIAAIRAIK